MTQLLFMAFGERKGPFGAKGENAALTTALSTSADDRGGHSRSRLATQSRNLRQFPHSLPSGAGSVVKLRAREPQEAHTTSPTPHVGSDAKHRLLEEPKRLEERTAPPKKNAAYSTQHVSAPPPHFCIFLANV